MHIEKMTVTTVKNGSGIQTEEKDYKIYNFEDLTSDNIFKIFYDNDSHIELGECFAWCSICGLEGPKHWNPYQAAKMFVDKSFTTVAEYKEFSPKYFAADIKRFSLRTIDQVKKFLQGETK